MARPTFKTKTEIPAGFEDDYEEIEGEWRFKEPDNSALTDALDAERSKREAAEKNATKAAAELKKLQNQGKADKAGLTDEQVQALRADVKAELEAEYAPFKTDAEKFKAENQSLLLDSKVKASLAKAGFLVEHIDDMWALKGKDFELTADGKPMVRGKPGIDVDKYIVDTYTKPYSDWVKGTQALGGGAGGQQQVQRVGAGPTADDIAKNPTEALRQARAAGATT
jgi:hypothetical protein